MPTIHVAWYPSERKYYASHDDLLFDFVCGTSLKGLMFIARARWRDAKFVFHYGHEFYF